MTSQQDKLQFFQALLWAAWSDDALLQVEQQIVRDLMSNASLDEESARQVESWFLEPPDEPDWTPFRADPAMGEALMRDIALIVLGDKVVNLEEMEQLGHVQSALGMADSDLHRILQEVEASLAERLGEG